MNNPKLVASLQKFKIDVYANLVSKDMIKDYLINVLGYEVWSGQKRLVCFDKDNPGIVYKIAYSTQGIDDNIFEVSCTNKLKTLLNQGEITLDDYNLFGEAKLVNNDPFIITMTAATNFIQDPDFIQWYRGYKPKAPDFNENQLFSIYVSNVPSLKEAYNRIQKILSTYFKPSDVTIFKEPKNYCLRTDRYGVKKLVLIDLGSVCPNLVRNGQTVSIRCKKCGASKIYVPIIINDRLTVNSSMTYEGVYACSNPDCQDYFGSTLSRNVTNETKDSYVFTAYTMENRDLIRSLFAIDGLYFVPDTRVINKIDYLRQLVNTLGIQPNENWLEILYRNYTYYACGVIYSMCGSQINELQLVQPNGGILTFSSYLNVFNQMLYSNGLQADSITNKTAAFTYINVLTSRDSELTIFDILTYPDWTTFATTIGQRYRVDQQNASLLFQSLHG